MFSFALELALVLVYLRQNGSLFTPLFLKWLLPANLRQTPLQRYVSTTTWREEKKKREAGRGGKKKKRKNLTFSIPLPPFYTEFIGMEGKINANTISSKKIKLIDEFN